MAAERGADDGTGQTPTPLPPPPVSPAPSPASVTSSPPPPRRWWVALVRHGALAVAWLIVVGLSIVVTGWMLRIGEGTAWSWAATAAIHLLLVGAWVPLTVAAWQRRWVLGVAAGLLVAVQVVLVWPMLPRPGAAADPASPALRLRSSNVYFDNPDPAGAAATLLDGDVDVISLVEVTPEVTGALDRAGIDDRYPHHVDLAAFGTVGTAVYARYPLEVVGEPSPAVLAVRVSPPDRPATTLFVVHAFPPAAADPGSWERTLDELDATMAATEGPWVAIGDYNATLDHRAYRDLLSDGRTDAHVATGRGAARSWPANGRLPAMLLIDRAVVSPGLRAVATAERDLPGSDHRMLDVIVAEPER